MQMYNAMIQVVSFDFFQMTEYIDFEFTPTEPWSDGFEKLGYETVNFMDGMGSILIFVWIGILFVIIVAFLSIFKTKCPLKFLERRFNP